MNENDDGRFWWIDQYSTRHSGEVNFRLELASSPPLTKTETLPYIDISLPLLFFGTPGKHKQYAQDAFDSCITKEAPWGYLRLLYEDPKLALSNLLLPLGIISGLVGFFVWRMPLSSLRFPCRKLGWPTPDDFNHRVEAKAGWVERVFSDTLREDYGVMQHDVIDLSK